MDPVRSHDIFREYLVHGSHLVWERISGLLVSNSVLLLAFFMAHGTPYFNWVSWVLPGIAIGICIGVGVALWAGAKAQVGLYEAICQVEEEPDFAYMKDKKIRPFTDIAGLQTESKRHLWKIGWYTSPCISIPFIIIWYFCLAAL